MDKRSKNDDVVEEPARGTLEALVSQFAVRPVDLDALTPQALGAIGRIHQVKTLASELETRVNLAGLDWDKLAVQWLESGKSSRTVEVYRRALLVFARWCSSRQINPLRLGPAGADDFVTSLILDRTKSHATARITAEAISSYYSWLSRRYSIRNPFLGSRIRPSQNTSTRTHVPDTATVQVVLNALEPPDASAIALLAYTGIPLGSISEVELAGDRFATKFKNRQIDGVVPPAAQAVLDRAMLNRRHPFEGMTDRKLTMRLRGQLVKLHSAGVVEYQYAATDFQDHYVVQTWRKEADMVALRDRLGHASVVVTEKALKRLGLV